MFLLIGSALKAQLVHDILKAKCFGLLADEFFDVSNKEQLVTFVKFVHPETGKANTAFLAASNLLGNSSSADAEAITNAIVAQLEDAGIDKKELSSFSSDGASASQGKEMVLYTALVLYTAFDIAWLWPVVMPMTGFSTSRK